MMGEKHEAKELVAGMNSKEVYDTGSLFLEMEASERSSDVLGPIFNPVIEKIIVPTYQFCMGAIVSTFNFMNGVEKPSGDRVDQPL